MNIPTHNNLIDVLMKKGYMDAFNVEIKNAKDNITNEIPVPFLYEIVNNPKIVDAVKDAFRQKNFNPQKYPTIEEAKKIIEQIFLNISDRKLLPDTDDVSDYKLVDNNLVSSLVLIGIRSRDFGGWFDDLLIATDKAGTIFQVFSVHTDLDLGFAPLTLDHPDSPSGYPLVVKPGFYKDVFQIMISPEMDYYGIKQIGPIPLYRMVNDKGEISFEYEVEEPSILTIGCIDGNKSDPNHIGGSYVAEFQDHLDHVKFIDALRNYYNNQVLLPDTVYNIDGKPTIIVSDMTKLSFILLEEKDFDNIPSNGGK